MFHVVIRCCLKKNDNIDNKDNSLIKKVVSRCHSLLFEEKRQHRQQRQQVNKKSCLTLSSKKNDNKDNKANTISVNQQYY